MTLRQTLRRVGPALLLVLALLGAALAFNPSPATSAPSGQAAAKAVYWSLGREVVEPHRIFTAYDSSPYVKGLTWKHWGDHQAVGKGVWVSTCASCSPPGHRAATIRLTGFVSCPESDPDVRTYRKAVVTVSKPDRGSHDTTYKIFAGCP